MLRGISNSTMKKKEVLNIPYIKPIVNTFLSYVTNSSHFTSHKWGFNPYVSLYIIPFKTDTDVNAVHHPLSYMSHLCMQPHQSIDKKLSLLFLLVYQAAQVEHFAMYA